MFWKRSWFGTSLNYVNRREESVDELAPFVRLRVRFFGFLCGISMSHGVCREGGACAKAKSAWVAQLVEHVLGKDEVAGSIPVPGSTFLRPPILPHTE